MSDQPTVTEPLSADGEFLYMLAAEYDYASAGTLEPFKRQRAIMRAQRLRQIAETLPRKIP